MVEQMNVNPPQCPPAPENQPAPQVNGVSRAVTCVWVMLGLQLLFSFVCAIGAGLILAAIMIAFDGDRMNYLYQNEFSTALVLCVTTFAGGALAAWSGARLMKVSIASALRKTKFNTNWLWKGVCMGYGVSIVLGFVVTIFNFLLSGLNLSIPESGPVGSSYFLPECLTLLATVIGAPLLEELLFRGVILNGLKRYGSGFAVLFSALLFALAHLNLYQGIPVFGLGLVLGFLYVRSGSIWVPVFVHFINNLIAMIVNGITSQSPALDILSTVVLLALAVIGIGIMVKEKEEIKAMIIGGVQKTEGWTLAVHSIGFWLLLVLFIGFSVSLIFFPTLLV